MAVTLANCDFRTSGAPRANASALAVCTVALALLLAPLAPHSVQAQTSQSTQPAAAADEATQTAPVLEPVPEPVPEPSPEPVPEPVLEQTAPPASAGMLSDAGTRAQNFLANGGPSIWAIAALSVITVALILWKTWRFFLSGVWSRRTSQRAVDLWEAGNTQAALALVAPRGGVRSRMTAATMRARLTLPDSAAREETSRVAKRLLASHGGGLRALELIATIAPLLGLLGTVLGMIAAFQALQEAGNRADPALLAGGIWEALLTTAAGMAVAIPASAALTWFEAVIESIRQDIEDLAARIFIAPAVDPVIDPKVPAPLKADPTTPNDRLAAQ